MLTRLKLKPLDHEMKRTIAMEGIVDNVKGYFAKRADAASMKEKKAFVNDLFGGRFSTREKKNPKFDQWINDTLLNRAFMQKKGANLTDIPMPIAQIGGKPVTDFPTLVAELKKMHAAASDIFTKLKPNTQFRQKLVEEFDKFKEGEEDKADALYEKVKDKLVPDEGIYWLKKGGKSWSAIGTHGKDVWPVIVSKDGKSSFYPGYVENDSLTVKAPDASEAAKYASLLKEVYDIWTNGYVQFNENYIDYWESFNGSYDELRNGDEIFDNIYTGQHHLLHEPMDVVIDIAYIMMVSFIYAL